MGLRNFGYELKQKRSVLKGFKYENVLERSKIRAFIYEIAGIVSVVVEDARGRRLEGATVTAVNTTLAPTSAVTDSNGVAIVFIDGILPNNITALKDRIKVSKDDFNNEINYTVQVQAPTPLH